MDLPNVQRQVNLISSLRLVSLENMANLNPDHIPLNVPNFESDLQESIAAFIMETLTVQDHILIEDQFIMRPHSDIHVVVHRADPDDNVFNIEVTFTIKYNNEAFWDYDDRFMDSDVAILQNAFLEYASRPQHENEVDFMLAVDDLDTRMADEEQFMPLVNPQMGGRRSSKRRSSRRNIRRSSRRSSRGGQSPPLYDPSSQHQAVLNGNSLIKINIHK
jgi:hypothetical protein